MRAQHSGHGTEGGEAAGGVDGETHPEKSVDGTFTAGAPGGLNGRACKGVQAVVDSDTDGKTQATSPKAAIRWSADNQPTGTQLGTAIACNGLNRPERESDDSRIEGEHLETWIGP